MTDDTEEVWLEVETEEQTLIPPRRRVLDANISLHVYRLVTGSQCLALSILKSMNGQAMPLHTNLPPLNRRPRNTSKTR